MEAIYRGIRTSDPAPAGAKFRATWSRTLVSRLFHYSALAAARAIQETGPQKGFYVVSPLVAAPEDDAIVLDVRTQRTWQGSAGQLAALMNDASGFDLTELRAVDDVKGTTYTPAKETAKQASDARADQQQRADAAADASVPDPVGGATKAVKNLVKWVAIGAGAFLVLTNLPALKAAGRVVKRVAK